MTHLALLAVLAMGACKESAPPSLTSDSATALRPGTPPAVSVAPAAPAATALLDTTRSSERAPDVFRVRFETTRGPLVVEAHRAWAPLGVDRFHYLVENGFYDGTRFFRVLPGFMAQFGLNGDPRITAVWKGRRIQDDPGKQSNKRGTMSFAHMGPDTRTTQLFINYRDNENLNGSFEPIGKVVEGMSVVDSLFNGYGEGAPSGPGPDQQRIEAEGEMYLSKNFPKLDMVRTARIVK